MNKLVLQVYLLVVVIQHNVFCATDVKIAKCSGLMHKVQDHFKIIPGLFNEGFQEIIKLPKLDDFSPTKSDNKYTHAENGRRKKRFTGLFSNLFNRFMPKKAFRIESQYNQYKIADKKGKESSRLTKDGPQRNDYKSLESIQENDNDETKQEIQHPIFRHGFHSHKKYLPTRDRHRKLHSLNAQHKVLNAYLKNHVKPTILNSKLFNWKKASYVPGLNFKQEILNNNLRTVKNPPSLTSNHDLEFINGDYVSKQSKNTGNDFYKAVNDNIENKHNDMAECEYSSNDNQFANWHKSGCNNYKSKTNELKKKFEDPLRKGDDLKSIFTQLITKPLAFIDLSSILSHGIKVLKYIIKTPHTENASDQINHMDFNPQQNNKYQPFICYINEKKEIESIINKILTNLVHKITISISKIFNNSKLHELFNIQNFNLAKIFKAIHQILQNIDPERKENYNIKNIHKEPSMEVQNNNEISEESLNHQLNLSNSDNIGEEVKSHYDTPQCLEGTCSSQAVGSSAATSIETSGKYNSVLNNGQYVSSLSEQHVSSLSQQLKTWLIEQFTKIPNQIVRKVITTPEVIDTIITIFERYSDDNMHYKQAEVEVSYINSVHYYNENVKALEPSAQTPEYPENGCVILIVIKYDGNILERLWIGSNKSFDMNSNVNVKFIDPSNTKTGISVDKSDNDIELDFRIIGGKPATSSGAPLQSKGKRSLSDSYDDINLDDSNDNEDNDDNDSDDDVEDYVNIDDDFENLINI